MGTSGGHGMWSIRKFDLKTIMVPIGALISDNSSVAALEFAIVGPLFFILLLISIDFGLLLFARAALDSATQSAGRTLQLGNPSAFPTMLCSQLPGYMNCNGVSYYVQAASSFGAMTQTVSYNANGALNNGLAQTYPAIPSPTGTPPSASPATPYMTIQVSYKYTFLIGWVATMMHAGGAVLVSTAAFEHE